MKPPGAFPTTRIALALSIALAFWVAAPRDGGASDVAFRTGFQYDWWKDRQDSSGRQTLVPVRLDARIGDFSAGLLTAYAFTHFHQDQVADRSLNNLLDTKLMTSYAVVGKLPVEILFGLDLNLPTGKTDLSREDLVLLMDPELVTVDSLGEGFNVNPTVAVAKSWEKFTAGIGAGYAWRGKYDLSTEAGMADFDPGDIVTLAATTKYRFSPAWTGRLVGTAAWYRNQSVRGVDLYREGDSLSLGAGIDRGGEKLSGGLFVKGIFRKKSRFLEWTGALVTEEQNSHGDEWSADLTMAYRHDRRTVVSTHLRGLLVTGNGYDPASQFFVGERRKVSLGLGVTRALAERIEAGISLKGFTMHDDAMNFPTFRTARSYRGFSGAISLATSY